MARKRTEQGLSPEAFFAAPDHPDLRRYEVARACIAGHVPAPEIAARFGLAVSTVHSLVCRARKAIREGHGAEFFLGGRGAGRPEMAGKKDVDEAIVELRRRNLSIPDIRARLDALGMPRSYGYVYNLLKSKGFGRLPRRSAAVRTAPHPPAAAPLEAPESELLAEAPEDFQSRHGGVLAFLPLLRRYGIDAAIAEAAFPGTRALPALQSALAFVALKLSNFQRYAHDDQWCMDAGLGLFAGLNVLPKCAWFSSYSFRVTAPQMHRLFVALAGVWKARGLLGGAQNLDFSAIPHWGDDTGLENNWSGKRRQALASLQALLAQAPESGIITWAHAGVRHGTADGEVLRFLDFWRESGGPDPQYLVFDSRLTTYGKLAALDAGGVKFLTIRRRGKLLVEALDALPADRWTRLRVKASGGTRSLLVHEDEVRLRGCTAPLRQIAIRGGDRDKPALLLTNDHARPPAELVRTYAERWLVEKEISEQIYFFHLNRKSSSIVVKVDFDLAMTVLAHNLYRLLGRELAGHERSDAQTLFHRFADNSADVRFDGARIEVSLGKKRHLPQLLAALDRLQCGPIPWLGNRTLRFTAATST